MYLKPAGSFILNIKEKALKGERHPYVLNLKEQFFGGMKEPNRFKVGFGRRNQEAVMVPMGDWVESRLKNLSETDRARDLSKNENGFGKCVSNWVGREYAYPMNVLHMATECGYKEHPATFPIELPSWFIELFTDPGDLVLYPYARIRHHLNSGKKIETPFRSG